MAPEVTTLLPSLEIVRLSALLHDIGKPQCWAERRPWPEHVAMGMKLLEPFGEDVSVTASRHHSGGYIAEDLRPSNDEERTIALAHAIAAGAAESDQSDGRPTPSLPIEMSHLLSNGDRIRRTVEKDELLSVTKRFEERFSREGKFEDALRFLEENLVSVPAFPNRPYNDSSLCDYLRLTAAIANCVWRQGFRGDDPSEYRFSLLSGDADRIKSYIAKSTRLPDLRARSRTIAEAAKSAVDEVAREMGLECTIYHGGGGFLVLTVPDMAEALGRMAEESFKETTGGQATMTTSSVTVSGKEVRDDFGSVWARASRELRRAKWDKEPSMSPVVEEGVVLCNVCLEREGKHAASPLHIDASVTPESLCDECERKREEGREGTALEEVKGKSDSIAVIRLDGDNVGSILDGRLLERRFAKPETPGRLASLSRLLHGSCERGMTRLLDQSRGLKIFAGGDDILAITPGEAGLPTAYALAKRLSDVFAGEITSSAGVVICNYRLPIYSALELSDALLGRAKEEEGKASVAFGFLEGVEGRRTGVSAGPFGGEDYRHSDGHVYKFSKVGELLELVGNLERLVAAAGQLRSIATSSAGSRLKAEVLIKYQVGRNELSWDEGIKLLDYNQSGMLADAFLIRNYFEKTGNV